MVSESERFAATNELFNEIFKIVNNRRFPNYIPELNERLTYLENICISLTYPVSENTEDTRYSDFVVINDYFRATDGTTDENSQLNFYPMFPEDAQLCRSANYYVQRVPCSAYGNETNSIIVNMACFNGNPRFLAHCFIHELGHAFAAKKEGRLFKKILRSQEERLEEDTKMWTVDYKIMLAIAGKNYRKAAGKMAEEINQWWKNKNKLPDCQGKGTFLRNYFGECQNTDLIDESDLTFFLYCALMAADYSLNQEAGLATKLRILRPIHIAMHKTELDLISNCSTI